MYFESHAHYNDKRFNEDRDELLGSILPEAGIDYVVNCGADMISSQESIELADKYDYFYASVGVHPHDALDIKDSDIQTLADWSAHEKVIAIGEIGLDYYYDYSPREIQVKRFKDQLQLAKDLHMPVIIHSRDANQETFDIIVESGIKAYGGVIHCYSGSPEMALEYVKMGFYIGVGGVVTFPNAKKLVDTVKDVPIENILLETDCPYLSPVPNRSKRNSSQNIHYICDKISQIKQISPIDIAKYTKENALKLFSFN